MISSNQAQELYKQTLFRLGAMLKLLKQGDSPDNRRNVQKHCEALSLEGKKQNLFGWVAIMETAQGAIAKPHHNYSTTTKLIIKEIKQASEYLLQGDVNAISVSDQLLELAPSARTRFMDVETIYAGADMDTSFDESESISSPEDEDKNNTLERDLWRETLFTSTEEVEETNELSFNENQISNLLEDNGIEYDEDDDLFLDTDDEETVNNFLTTKHNDTTGTSEFFSSISTHTNQGESIDSLLDDMELLDNVEAPAQDVEDDWDFLEEEELEEQEELSSDSDDDHTSVEDDIIDSLDDLFDTQSAIDFGTDNLTIHNEIPNPRQTVIIENARDEISEITPQQVPVAEKSNSNAITVHTKLIIYEQFDELEQTINQENHFLTETEISALEIELPSVTHHYYETFEELEKIINRAQASIPEVNWQQLENIVNEGLEVSVSSLGSENNLEKELSDLDRLLAEAEKPSSAQKWKKPPAPSAPSQKQPTFEQSMRVPVKQLDNLNNLIGEMVIRRNRLEEDQEKLRQFLDNLLSHAQDLSEVGDRTQDMYEKSLLQGSLISSRKRNQSTVREQLERGNIIKNPSPQDNNPS
ncbi:hybrid sensor histidine kinase/response regulator, partial [Cyanobacterium stanieri LEGE 03274]|nr:hybrid sensor histidine kinase/response regulator [Cyanobacterium stanieri LEGE 03274]